jgi:hypothetical protein
MMGIVRPHGGMAGFWPDCCRQFRKLRTAPNCFSEWQSPGAGAVEGIARMPVISLAVGCDRQFLFGGSPVDTRAMDRR